MIGYNDQSDYRYTAVSNLTTNQIIGLRTHAYAYHTLLKNAHFSYSALAPSTALKNTSQEERMERWNLLQHAQSLECQGQVMRCTEEDAAKIWFKTVQKLPPDLPKFSVNAVQDTLPHNTNLAKWRGKENLSSAC